MEIKREEMKTGKTGYGDRKERIWRQERQDMEIEREEMESKAATSEATWATTPAELIFSMIIK